MATGTVLKDIGSCKQRLLSGFINDDDICELLFDKKSYTEDDVEKLVYTQIFPYLYIDDVQTQSVTYLCFEINIPSCTSSTIKDLEIIIWACCHKDIISYSKKGYYGTKVDILADMVERRIRESYDFGIGKPELVSVTNFFPNNKYYGRQLVYSVPEFKVKG